MCLKLFLKVHYIHVFRQKIHITGTTSVSLRVSLQQQGKGQFGTIFSWCMTPETKYRAIISEIKI